MCTEILPGVFHIDHTRPLRYGGEDNMENVTALCIQCHAEKTQNESNIWENITTDEIANESLSEPVEASGCLTQSIGEEDESFKIKMKINHHFC
jgi:hypothetical protein